MWSLVNTEVSVDCSERVDEEFDLERQKIAMVTVKKESKQRRLLEVKGVSIKSVKVEYSTHLPTTSAATFTTPTTIKAINLIAIYKTANIC